MALSAVFAKPHRFRRVLILNGAEGSDIAETVIRACPSVEFLNICVKDDGILKTMGGAFEPRLGYHGCMGRDGVAVMAPNYREIFLDDPETQSAVLKAFAVGVEGDDPSEWADHHYSFLHSPNWKLYRIFFEKGLAGLKALD
ncbi:MAG: hypothetical protein JKY94_17750 [Rhodobacteraceae bacterium]|nr:hypothetical protein [Paracoccaceae bacterium]